MSEDVAVENETTVEVAEDVTVDTQETEVGTEVEADAESVQEPEMTVEERLAELEKDNQGKQAKINRQLEAYNKIQEAYQRQKQELDKLQELARQQQPEIEPNIDDYETHEEYIEAVVDFRAKQKLGEEQQKLLKQQEQMQYQMLQREREAVKAKQEAEYMQVNPMYKAAASEVATFVQQNVASPEVGNAVLDVLYQGNVPQVIDYFGKNNGENLGKLGEIMNMPPHLAAVEIYKIQQTLKTPEKKQNINVPKPVQAPSGKSKAVKPLAKRDSASVLDWVNS